MDLRAGVVLDSVALTIFVAGLMWLAELNGLPGELYAESSYLGGVFARSFGNFYQPSTYSKDPLS